MRKGSVHDANEANVWQLKVLEDATQKKIQEALTKSFKQHTHNSGNFLKMSTMTGTQISDQFSVQDQFKNNVLDSKIYLNEDQDNEKKIVNQFWQFLQRGFT